MKPCAHCVVEPQQRGDYNIVPGAMFVGWGMGWQTCSACGGTAVEPEPVIKHLRTAEQRIDVALEILRDAVVRSWEGAVSLDRVLSAIRALNGCTDPPVRCPWCGRGHGAIESKCPACGGTIHIPTYGSRR